MRKTLLLIGVLFMAVGLHAGFKVKLIKPKKAEQFQVRTTIDGITFAADLLLKEGEQKAYFYKELTPFNIIAVRLAVFNGSQSEVVLPLDDIQLRESKGGHLPRINSGAVAMAVLQGRTLTAGYEPKNPPVAVSPTAPDGDPRIPTGPGYDPRQPPLGRQEPWGRPGVDIVLNPGGGTVGTGDLSSYEKVLVEKDFADKCHTDSPILASYTRDRFLYFLLPNKLGTPGTWTLRLGSAKGISRDVVLQFSPKSR